MNGVTRKDLDENNLALRTRLGTQNNYEDDALYNEKENAVK